MTVKFNGLELPNWITVTEVSFQALSEIEMMEYSSPRSVGGVDGGVERGGSTITLKLFMEKTDSLNIHEQKRELKRWAMGDNWKASQIIFTEQPDKYYMGRVTNSIDINDLFTHGETEVTLYCADPLAYDIDETVVKGNAGKATIDYDGLEKAYATVSITLEKACEQIVVRNTKTNSEMVLKGSFKKNDKVTIDSNRKKISVNDKVAMKIMMFDSDWLYLEMGKNDFTVKSDLKDNINDFKIEYKKAD